MTKRDIKKWLKKIAKKWLGGPQYSEVLSIELQV
jgi:hypothetical protein